ncbi:hypothetical protein MRB53_010443 [Persea americana]|uniref:Uncharacterized protein n=1 Tax=Persea americana TaxID=3435 RepID=A0ACC2LRR8_PERAE|nr:hypothetical protein MRB53_010443 [Persea americana]
MEVNPWQWLIGGNLESFLIQGWGDLKVSWRDESDSRGDFHTSKQALGRSACVDDLVGITKCLFQHCHKRYQNRLVPPEL